MNSHKRIPWNIFHFSVYFLLGTTAYWLVLGLFFKNLDMGRLLVPSPLWDCGRLGRFGGWFERGVVCVLSLSPLDHDGFDLYILVLVLLCAGLFYWCSPVGTCSVLEARLSVSVSECILILSLGVRRVFDWLMLLMWWWSWWSWGDDSLLRYVEKTSLGSDWLGVGEVEGWDGDGDGDGNWVLGFGLRRADAGYRAWWWWWWWWWAELVLGRRN